MSEAAQPVTILALGFIAKGKASVKLTIIVHGRDLVARTACIVIDRLVLYR